MILSRFGTRLLPQAKAFWAVKLKNGSFLSELDRRAGRAFDWTLDLVDTGDVLKVTELWLFCPPTLRHPLGQTARLPIVEPGTAFQLKVACVHGMGEVGRNLVSQVIGRIDDKEQGSATCFVWDDDLRALGTWNPPCIYGRVPSWRPEVAPISGLSHAVMGLEIEG